MRIVADHHIVREQFLPQTEEPESLRPELQRLPTPRVRDEPDILRVCLRRALVDRMAVPRGRDQLSEL